MSFPPSDPEYGRNCLLCHPPGETPLTFAFSMQGVRTGGAWVPGMPQPRNGLHFVTQDPVFDCLWKSIHAPTEVRTYNCNVAFTQFEFEESPGIFFFSSTLGPGCHKFFTNDLNDPVNDFYWGGSVRLIPTWLVTQKWEEYTPIVDPDPQLNFFSRSDGKVVLQYTDSWGDTNISMLVDL